MKNILDILTGLTERSVRSDNQMEGSLRKRPLRTKAAKERGSSDGHSLPGNGIGRKRTCDANIGVNRSSQLLMKV